jgi:hypothetical protein
MSGDPRENDRLVDALLAAHQVPALSGDFADRVLAAAQSPRGGQVNVSPRWRRSQRPWRRSPFLLGFLALNIVAASAVAAMVTGIPVWHHVTEIVEKVTHSWHRQPVHSSPRDVVPPRFAKLHASGSSPALITITASEPQTAAVISTKAQETVRSSGQHHTKPRTIGGPGNYQARLAPRRLREKLMRHRLSGPFEMHARRARGGRLPLEARRNPLESFPRAQRDRPLREKEPLAAAFPRGPRPVASLPPEPYGPRLEPQRALPERQTRADEPQKVSRWERAEQRRMRGVDRRPGRPRRPPHGRRFNF